MCILHGGDVRPNHAGAARVIEGKGRLVVGERVQALLVPGFWEPRVVEGRPQWQSEAPRLGRRRRRCGRGGGCRCGRGGWSGRGRHPRLAEGE